MYVYFIGAFHQHELLRIKIGSSRHPEKRMATLQTGSPAKLRLLGTVRCKSDFHARQIEKYAHNIFYKQRRRGEWFRLSRTDLEQVKSLIARAAERNDLMDADSLGEDRVDELTAAFRATIG